jgi:hypothetical protein
MTALGVPAGASRLDRPARIVLRPRRARERNDYKASGQTTPATHVAFLPGQSCSHCCRDHAAAQADGQGVSCRQCYAFGSWRCM